VRQALEKTITLNVLGGSAVIQGPDGVERYVSTYDRITVAVEVKQIISPFWARFIPRLIKTELEFTGFDNS
jgi:hypothetical protein